jgi:Ca2+-dependent lipid-binding protein
LKPTSNTDKPILLKLKVISGHQLPKPKSSSSTKSSVSDPYVEIEIIGTETDSTKCKTKTIDDNGLHPVWNEEFRFIISNPELAFVRFQIFDSDRYTNDDLIGSYTVAFSALAQGINLHY